MLYYIYMLRAITSNAKVFDCTNPESPFTGILTDNQALFYIADLGGAVDRFKGGQTYRPGLTLEEAFQERYRDHSGRSTAIIASHLFVFNAIFGRPRSGANPTGFDYDEYIRKCIIKAHRQGRIKFSAVIHATSGVGNSERLIDFDPTRDEADLVKIVKEALGLSKSRDTRPFTFWRYGQEEVIDGAYQILQERGKVLIAAYTGFGKTRVAMEIVVRLLEPTGGLALVLTPVTDTKTGFDDAINGPCMVGLDRSVKKTVIDARQLHKLNIAKLRKRANKGEVIIIVGSVQDARYDDGTTGLREKYRPLIGNLDVIVNDERHKEFNAVLTSSRLSELTAPYRIDLSATPYNFWNEFRDDEIIARTLIWGLRYRAYTALPEVQIRAMDTAFATVDPIFAEQYVSTEGFDPRKWFVRTDGKTFDNAKALVKAAIRMYDQLDSDNKNPLSISGSCGLWKLPDGLNGDGVAYYIPALADLLNASVEDVHFIDAARLESLAKYSTIGSAVETLLKTHKKVVILTGEKFLTGTDIQALDHVVLFDKMSSLQNFEQLMGRLMRVRQGKELVRMYCLQPATELQILEAQIAGVQSNYADGVTKKEALATIPLTYYDGAWKTYSAEEILAALQEHFRSRLRNRLPSAELDEALIEAIALLTELSKKYGAGASKKFVMTEDNDSRITKAMKKRFTTKQKSTFAQWREFMQELTQDLRAVAKMTDCYQLNKLLKHPLLVGHFDDDLKRAVRVLNKEKKLRDCLTRMLEGVREAFLNLPDPTDWLDDVFLNTKSKARVGLVYTPLTAARELIAQIDAPHPTTVLVTNANNGAFAFAARERWPEARILCYEVVDYYKDWLMQNGFEVITERELMAKTFDVTVGNPPYQDGTGKSSNKLWKKITELAIDRTVDGGYVAFVTPPSWMSPGSLYTKIMSHDMQYVNLNVEHHFPNVGSSFSAWILCKRPSSGTTVFETTDATFPVDHSGLAFLPNEINPLSVSITRKMMNTTAFFNFVANNENDTRNPHMSETKDKVYRWKVLHTNNQTYWSSRKPAEYHIPKVMITRSGNPIPTYSEACGVSQVMYYVPVADADTGNRLVKILQSKLYQLVLNYLWKYSGWNQLEVLRSLPSVDTSINWTDAELYQHFGLTQEEISYVEANSK